MSCNCYHIEIPQSVQTDGINEIYLWQKGCNGYYIAAVWNSGILTYMNGTTAVYDICLDNEYGIEFSYGFSGTKLTPAEIPSIVVNILGDCTFDGNCFTPPTPTQTQTQTQTPSPTTTLTATPTQTSTQTQTPSQTATQTQTPSQTGTPTQTPTATKVICGLGITSQYYSYFDCCGNYVKSEGAGQEVVLDYTKPFQGITRLNLETSQPCPTQTSTPTQTQTTSQTQTQTPTPSFTQTPSQTPTSTPIVTCSPEPNGFENECEVFTLFDMGVTCNLIKEPSVGRFDGILSVNVTGGTAPYTFYWNTGERTQTISNIPYGSYTVLVVDYYGDYSATTACNLIAPTPTATPTQTLTQTPTATLPIPTLCLRFVSPPSFGTSGGSGTYQELPLTFVPSGSQNNKPTWYNYSKNFTIYWNNSATPNRWDIASWNLGGTPISTNQGQIPDTNWVFIGTPATYSQIISSRGACPTVSPLTFTYQITPALCNGVCNGGLTIVPSGGQPPYSYSIDGVNFQSSNIFSNLCPSTFGLIIKDSVGRTFQQSLTVTAGGNTTLQLTPIIISSNSGVASNPSIQSVNWRINCNPPIPVGITLTGEIVLNISQIEQGPTNSSGPATVYTITANNNAVLNNNTLTLNSSNITTQSVTSSCNSALISASQDSFAQSTLVSLGNGYILTGQTISSLNILNGVLQNNCVTTAKQSITINLVNFRVLGSPCYDVETSNLTLINNHTFSSGGLGN